MNRHRAWPLAGILLAALVTIAATLPTTSVTTNRLTHPADKPVIVEITISNTTTAAWSYSCGGPDTYPPDECFTNCLVDAKRTSVSQIHNDWLRISNGQSHRGSSATRRMPPGSSARIPFSFIPPPPGNYELFIQCNFETRGHLFLLNIVTNNPSLSAEWETNFIARVRNHEGIAYQLLRQIREMEPPLVVSPLWTDLDAAEIERADAAAEALVASPDPMPADASIRISRCLDRALQDPKPWLANSMAWHLCDLASHLGPGEAVPILVRAARSNLDWATGNSRLHAVKVLARYRDRRAVGEIKKLCLNGDRFWVRQTAIRLLVDKLGHGEAPVATLAFIAGLILVHVGLFILLAMLIRTPPPWKWQRVLMLAGICAGLLGADLWLAWFFVFSPGWGETPSRVRALIFTFAIPSLTAFILILLDWRCMKKPLLIQLAGVVVFAIGWLLL